ncbi:N-acetylmuramic acid 6-phosphate etherase, partial [Francisella tularensis subsp. holarctica]|nr:N-acetylmuramic acid 6-phosphate etherase [Francisella tularensis subsp. holarctica]
KFYLKANKSVKVAIVMILNNCDYEKALAILKNNKNFIKS